MGVRDADGTAPSAWCRFTGAIGTGTGVTSEPEWLPRLAGGTNNEMLPRPTRGAGWTRWLVVWVMALAFAAVAVVALLRLPGGHGGPAVVTTPDDNAGTNGAPDLQTVLSAGNGALLEGQGNAYWCTTSSCGDGPSLAAWTSGEFGSAAGGALPNGMPVLAGLTEIQGDILRLSLLSCRRQACTAVGGGAFTAPGFTPSGGLNSVYVASASNAGFAVVFGDYDAAGAESLYVVVCDPGACRHPNATRLAGPSQGAGDSDAAVAAAPHGGFAVAVPDLDGIKVYECVAAPCHARAQQVPANAATGTVAISVTSSGQTLLAYDTSDAVGGSRVVLEGAAPGGSFSQLAAVRAPVAAVNPGNVVGAQESGPPTPAIEFSGRDLMAVSEDSSGHAVMLTTCAVVSCGTTIKVSKVADVGHPIVDLGIGVPAGTLRILWATQDTDFLGAIHYSGHLWIASSAYP